MLREGHGQSECVNPRMERCITPWPAGVAVKERPAFEDVGFLLDPNYFRRPTNKTPVTLPSGAGPPHRTRSFFSVQKEAPPCIRAGAGLPGSGANPCDWKPGQAPTQRSIPAQHRSPINPNFERW